MKTLEQQINDLKLQILTCKLESPFHKDINKLNQQLDELYARQSAEQA